MSPRDAATKFSDVLPLIRHSIALGLMLVTGVIGAYQVKETLADEIKLVDNRLELHIQRSASISDNLRESVVRMAQNNTKVHERLSQVESETRSASRALAVSENDKENLKDDIGELKSSVRGLSTKVEEASKDNQAFQREVLRLLRQNYGD